MRVRWLSVGARETCEERPRVRVQANLVGTRFCSPDGRDLQLSANSTVSPLCVFAIFNVPEGISITAKARSDTAIRQGPRFDVARRTRPWRSTKSTSIANRMKNV